MKIELYQTLKTMFLAALNRENETHYKMRDIDTIWISSCNVEMKMTNGECYNVHCCISI